ncbi:alanyl-tRNA editing protein [Falsigemmobacter intermedius]|uniref:Alanine--tRNA ligase n=1 Tax=Falsigemmobacter intermedius TaxID=1553448 RepID=A0A444MGF1_9RHOB|nr:alanyl-tRNA editing protein [Falsigemmobacter intermedius]RWY44754.1 alanyl-tRNA editing protein [Falsigemmobacter intermedius]
MTADPLYRSDAYARETIARVVAQTDEGGLILEPELFYPQGGGQPGDSGWLDWEGGRITIANTVKSPEARAVLLAAEPGALPPVGAEVRVTLDWERRYKLMRVHTALHLLSVVIPLPVTGGQISEGKGRLDFDMPEVPADVAAIEEALNALISRDLPVSTTWITDEELTANPGLVKTMSVKPPTGQGRVRLVQIGEGEERVDLQPCGGTHVARTAEVGRARIGKIEKKGKQNRRVSLVLDDPAKE